MPKTQIVSAHFDYSLDLKCSAKCWQLALNPGQNQSLLYKLSLRNDCACAIHQDKPQADRTRVGGATDDLLTEGGIGATVITASAKEGGNTAARNLSRLQTRNNADKTLQQAYSQINRIGDKLGLTKTITGTAQHYYKLVYEKKGARGRGLAAVAAAVLYCACRQEGLARTFKVPASLSPSAPVQVTFMLAHGSTVWYDTVLLPLLPC